MRSQLSTVSWITTCRLHYPSNYGVTIRDRAFRKRMQLPMIVVLVAMVYCQIVHNGPLMQLPRTLSCYHNHHHASGDETSMENSHHDSR